MTDTLSQQMLNALREAERVLAAFYPEKHKTLVQVRAAIKAAESMSFDHSTLSLVTTFNGLPE